MALRTLLWVLMTFSTFVTPSRYPNTKFPATILTPPMTYGSLILRIGNSSPHPSEIVITDPALVKFHCVLTPTQPMS